jgi:hypothetical protein
MPQTIYRGHVSVFDKLFTLTSCKCKNIYIYTATR